MFRIKVFDGLSNHCFDNFLDRGLCRKHIHQMAVSEHTDPFRDTINFFESMGDVDDTLAILFQFFDDCEQTLCFFKTQSSCRLIHDNDTGILGK